MTLPRYAEYRGSGVAWLGSIPQHWAVVQSRRYFKDRTERARESDRQLTASQKHGMLYQADFMQLEGQKVTQVILGADILKHVEPNDFVISMRSFQGGLEWCGLQGCMSSAYVALTPRQAIHPPFFAHLFKSDLYIQALQATTNLVRDGQALRFSNFAQVPLPLMPIQEQQAIATFLDNETAKIDGLIAEQEKLIALLSEKRQATISHAVTRGLNPQASMKDSGVPWLGEVPAHWRVGKAGFYVTVLPGYAFPSTGFSLDEADVRLLRGINVAVGALRWDEAVYWKRAAGDGLDAFELKAGDVVIGMDRPLVSSGMRVATVSDSDLPCLLLQRVAKIQPGLEMDARFIMRLLGSRAFEAHFAPETTGVSVPHISGEQITDFVISVAPLEEQRQICEFLEGELTRLESLQKEALRAVDLLREHRSALIAAAVTGQIDVRGLPAA